MVDFAIDPKRTALINVDLQNCFVAGYPISAPEGLAILPRINALSAACRKAGATVVHTAATLRPDLSNIGVQGEVEPFSGQGMFAKGSVSAALHEGLEVEPGDIILEKPRFGAFHATDLELILRARGIEAVIITGICTNVCCETTAREAAVRDFRVLFTSDGTATINIGNVSADELQRATCATISRVFGQVLTVAEAIGKVEGTA